MHGLLKLKYYCENNGIECSIMIKIYLFFVIIYYNSIIILYIIILYTDNSLKLNYREN